MTNPAVAGFDLLLHVVTELFISYSIGLKMQQENEIIGSSRYWLVKFAPFRTPWSEIVQRGKFTLRGVRSPAARKHLSAMRRGDRVLYYHSQQELAVVGIMEVTREAYPDPTCANQQWLTCDFVPIKTLACPVSLEAVKADSRLMSLALIRQPRLAVMPITEEQFQIISG
jgi:predicted RNA-binding protein with PUA-like domain